jgi:hypothetical protein
MFKEIEVLSHKIVETLDRIHDEFEREQKAKAA